MSGAIGPSGMETAGAVRTLWGSIVGTSSSFERIETQCRVYGLNEGGWLTRASPSNGTFTKRKKPAATAAGFFPVHEMERL
jgi:hypothetical protein